MNLGEFASKQSKSQACSEVATFLFCFFIYLGLLAALVNPRGGASKQLKSKLAPLSQPFFFNLLGIIHLRFAVADEPEKGRFKTIKKPSLLRSRNLSFLICLGLSTFASLWRMNPRRVASKQSKSQACSEVATFLFCFFPVVKASFPTVLKAKKPAFRLAF